MSARWLTVVLMGTILWVCASPAISLASDDSTAVAQEIDRLLAEAVTSQDREHVPRVDDATFLRRAFLDIVGTPPTPDDVLAFLADDDPEKRSKVIQQLLADPDYGRNWAKYWRDVILYRRSEDRALMVSNAVTAYLTQQFNENTSWANIAQSFVTAIGDVQTEGSTALIMAQAGKPEETVAEVSRIFLGIQIQCAQCHDHPTDQWKREQFHQLAAFFPRVAVRPQPQAERRTFVVAATDVPMRRFRPNNNNRFRGTPEHYMPDLENPQAQGTLMTPVFFVSGESLSLGTPDEERRRALATWITDNNNPWFSKALVNRMWSELCGEGFYEPVDDIGPDRRANAEPVLNYLAEQFTAHNHDLKWLMATILQTDLYQRETRPRRVPSDPPFQANIAQRLRGDQLLNALSLALGLPSPPAEQMEMQDGMPGMMMMAMRNPARQFNFVFGYDPSLRRDEVAGTIAQAQALMNARNIGQAIRANRGTLAKVLRENEDDADAITELYLRTVSRPPSKAELKTCTSFIKEVGNRGESLEDVLWSLINSTEFSHRN